MKKLNLASIEEDEDGPDDTRLEAIRRSGRS